MRRFFSIGVFAIIISCISLSSCKKVWDEIKHHPDGAADNCHVTQIADSWYNADYEGYVYDTARYVYNNNGDPVRVNRSASRDVYISDQAFVYDNQYRLLAFVDDIPSYGHITKVGFAWHTYTYVNASTIKDSLFVYPSGDYTISYKPTSYDHVEVSTLTLDSWGRIIKEQKGDGTEIVYSYDANGNLIKPGVNYTNKTNIRQTHKTWMFIDRDYSVNQPEGDAIAFNGNKLPTKFNNTYRINFGGYSYFQGMVTYSCK
ncbi:MAG: hypothetical protein QM802_19320 [Agriterribacter sp.]